MENRIKSWRRVIAILISASFFCIQIVYFCNVAPYAPTKLFQYLFMIDSCIFFACCGLIIKRIDHPLNMFDGFGLSIIVFSMVCICLLSFMEGPFSMKTAWVSGVVAILVGIIGKVNRCAFARQAYLLWGMYVLLWTSNWYNSVY